ncbi:hypothetical protein LNAOJCKE_3191 [Methylorubrum aminovorans]|uniref:WD40 repeat domain-containing protein n=1 Tax=Methylorubrum aminovorans TaxID=269069 RepID=A0ABQ4UHH4_9HYPH|nr:hypothetical protein [Methylorubrum aminovorans]GJE65977.1 hypothetical protein LNAOJCKE_3191 [Methylorubrum aminovorans]GMA77940.1 hypothetical protein GCM10025880_43570 [Methylorubrum aminovorans]
MQIRDAIPAVARRLLVAIAIVLASTNAWADERPVQSVKPAGATVNFAQTLDWIGDDVFAVGRWDGTISVFRVPEAKEYGPVILQAMSTPAGRGIEMLAAVGNSAFVTSDGAQSLALWRRPAAGTPFKLAASLGYDPSIGTANSGLAFESNGVGYLISGHESGHVLVWRRMADDDYQLAATVDVRSPEAPSNPWGLRNVRGLVRWQSDRLIAGSEDGDLVAITIPEGREIFRHRYNAKAQRGINGLSAVGDKLLVANCAVGASDRNIWLFDLSQGRPVLSDSENLVLDSGRAQVFNFDVDLVAVPNSGGTKDLIFFSSTEEGLLWQGRVQGDQVVMDGVTRISPEGAAIMAVGPKGNVLATAAYAIRLFKTK